jgi:hypothetical protein
MRRIATLTSHKIAAARYAGAPALVPAHAYRRKQTGTLYQR